MAASSSAVAAQGGVLTAEQVAEVLVEPLLATEVVTRATPDGNIVPARGEPVRWPLIDAYDLADPWRGQTEQIAEADPTYDELVLLPPTLKGAKVIHRVSRQLVRRSSPAVLDALANAIVRRLALTFDRAFLVGDGADNTPTGLVNITDVTTVADVGTPDVDTLHDAVGTAMAADANPSAWFLTPREWTTLRKTKATGSGEYLLQPDPTEAGRFLLLGIPAFPTTQLPTDGGAGTESQIILADMDQVIIAVDEEPDVTILLERYAEFDQVGIRVTARMDLGALNPEGIVVLDGVTP